VIFEIAKTARAAGLKLQSKGIADISELDSALAEVKQSGATTLIAFNRLHSLSSDANT
jgi:hypothetical protein